MNDIFCSFSEVIDKIHTKCNAIKSVNRKGLQEIQFCLHDDMCDVQVYHIPKRVEHTQLLQVC